MVVTVPPIRKHLGWTPAERIPTTFPRECGHALLQCGHLYSRAVPLQSIVVLLTPTLQFPTVPADQSRASRTPRTRLLNQMHGVEVCRRGLGVWW